jgi:hypothetical protein
LAKITAVAASGSDTHEGTAPAKADYECLRVDVEFPDFGGGTLVVKEEGNVLAEAEIAQDTRWLFLLVE